jgi:hypothetical protein
MDLMGAFVDICEAPRSFAVGGCVVLTAAVEEFTAFGGVLKEASGAPDKVLDERIRGAVTGQT